MWKNSSPWPPELFAQNARTFVIVLQMAKRIFLFTLVNILVMVTITLVLGVFGVGRYFPQGGLAGLAACRT